MFGFGRMMGPRPFIIQYHCYSISMFPGHNRQEVENGGKILLPPSALQHLTHLRVVYPMLFKLTNQIPDNRRSTHCGVLEFIADEGNMYIPYWMMRNLMIDEGAMVQIENVTLPVATFSKFEPQSAEFLEISNPKAMLENALRSFACLSAGDVIAIRYNDRIYELRVLETKPGNAVSIIECDMDVDFAKPVGYVEPEVKRAAVKENEENQEPKNAPTEGYQFVGGGYRLDGRSVPAVDSNPSSGTLGGQRGIPDYDFRIGHLDYARNVKFITGNENANSDKQFKPFGGSGNSIKNKK